MRIVLLLLLLPAIAAAQPVRVSLFGLLAPREMSLSAPDPLRASLRAGSDVSSIRIGPAALTVRAAGDRLQLSGGSFGTRWTDALTAGPGRMRASVAGAPARPLHGTLELAARGGVLRVILSLPPEKLAESSALAEKVPGSASEAVRAQAVACLSYVLSHRGRHGGSGFDLCDTTHCQRFAGSLEDPAAVPREVLTWRGEPAPAYYTADCGGQLEEPAARWGARGPHRVGRDPWCDPAGAAWERAIPLGELRRAIGQDGVEAISIVPESARGLVAGLRAGSRESDFETVSRELRRSMGRWPIPGRRFTLEVRGGWAILMGRGRGHLSGLCQTGANSMARAGKRYQEILRFYYPQARLQALNR